MTDITFVRTRHVYDSYGDFFKLVELADFPTIYVDELDVSRPGVYIVSPMNGEWRPHVDNQADRRRNAHLILWNIERPAGSAGAVGKYAVDNWDLMHKRHVDEVWVSDRRLAAETELRHVVLGSHPGLGEPGALSEKRWNAVHMSYTGPPRRQTVYKQVSNMAPNCWPPERDAVLRASRFALNVHQDQHPFQEPLRFALFAAYGLPILSETIYDAYPYSEETMAFAAYNNLAATISRMATKEDYNHWREVGLRCRAVMTEQFEFGKMVRLAVSQSVGDWR